MEDYYDMLGIGRSATPGVVKIAFEGKMKALDKSGLAGTQRKAEEKVLQQACATLSDPAKKAWYDKQLDATSEEEEDDAPEKKKSSGLVMGAVAAAVVVAIAAGWYVSHPSAEKQQQARKAEDAAARKAYEDKVNSAGTNKNPNPFRNGQPSAVKDQMMKNAIDREAQAREKVVK